MSKIVSDALGLPDTPTVSAMDMPLRRCRFTPTDFEQVRRLIAARAGIALASSKTEMVYGRLLRRVRIGGHADFASYLAPLARDAADPEWEFFVNALTTNLTAFFREAHHFEILARQAATLARPMRIWCAAASTGEEAYSIAITLAEAFTARDAARCEIVATDIDTTALATAQRGIYGVASIRRLSEERRRRFFQIGQGSKTGLVRVAADLRDRIRFLPANLSERGWPFSGRFDAIFCRNLMIYFDRPTQQRVLNNIAPLLLPDGRFYAGHSENFAYFDNPFELEGQTVYRLKKTPS